MSSGPAQTWVDGAAANTFEGTPVVMNQQCARYLFVQLDRLSKDRTLVGFFKYLNDIDMLLHSKLRAKTPEEFIDMNTLVRTLAVRAAYYINLANTLIKSSNLDLKVKLNEKYALHVHRMVKCHIQYVMALFAIEYVDRHKFADKNIRPLLMLLIKVWILKQLQSDTQGLYACGYFSAGAQELVDDSMHKLLVELRPHMIPLAESLAIDAQDYNTIGNKYGDIYELQFETAKNARINKHVVPHFYEKYMKPTMTMHKAKL
jgi:hypothetical protein